MERKYFVLFLLNALAFAYIILEDKLHFSLKPATGVMVRYILLILNGTYGLNGLFDYLKKKKNEKNKF